MGLALSLTKANSGFPGDAIDRGHKSLWRSVSEFGTKWLEGSDGEIISTIRHVAEKR